MYRDGRRYFATGDIGEFREDGSLMIIGKITSTLEECHHKTLSSVYRSKEGSAQAGSWRVYLSWQGGNTYFDKPLRRNGVRLRRLLERLSCRSHCA